MVLHAWCVQQAGRKGQRQARGKAQPAVTGPGATAVAGRAGAAAVTRTRIGTRTRISGGGTAGSGTVAGSAVRTGMVTGRGGTRSASPGGLLDPKHTFTSNHVTASCGLHAAGQALVVPELNILAQVGIIHPIRQLTPAHLAGQSGPGRGSMSQRGPNAAVMAAHINLRTGHPQQQTGAQVKRTGKAAAKLLPLPQPLYPSLSPRGWW